MADVYNGCVFHFNAARDVTAGGTAVLRTLQSHPMYYVSRINKDGHDDYFFDADTVRRCACALLLLHSMPFRLRKDSRRSFFNFRTSDHGGCEMIPYGVLLLYGGLIYRKRFVRDFGGADIFCYDANTDYKIPDADETFFVSTPDGPVLGFIESRSSAGYVKMEDIVDSNMDIRAQNRLCAMFQSFAQENGVLIEDMHILLRKAGGDGAEGAPSAEDIEYSGMKAVNEACKAWKGDIGELNRVVSGMTQIYGDGTCVVGFDRCHEVCTYKDGMLRFYYKEGGTEVQKLMDRLYNHKSVVLTNYRKGTEDGFSIRRSDAKLFLDNFGNALRRLYDKGVERKSETASDDYSVSKNDADDDLKKSIYWYFKNFWDRWMTSYYFGTSSADGWDSSGNMPFTTGWFEKNFFFMNSKYENIAEYLKLDCSKLYALYEGGVGPLDSDQIGMSLCSYINKVAENHDAMLFCYPDFVNFDNNGVKVLEDLFKAVPTTTKEGTLVRDSNQFVFMRVNRAQVGSFSKDYKDDYYELPDDGTKDSMPYDIGGGDGTTGDYGQYGLGHYRIPSFGVSFSSSSNHIFKSMNVGMDTCAITDQTLRTMSLISSLGNRGNHSSVTFYGSDIFSVYSTYSYSVTVVMMGDMQIQPLMIFKLLNVPMFNGTYIVISVSHNVQPGSFTTTFVGVKLSRIDTCPNNSWLTIEPEAGSGFGGDGSESGTTGKEECRYE